MEMMVAFAMKYGFIIFILILAIMALVRIKKNKESDDGK